MVKEKNNLGFIYCIYGILFWASQYVIQPYLIGYLYDIGASESFAGIIIGCFGVFQIFTRIPIGLCSDRANKQRIFIIIGDIVLVISCLLLYFVRVPIAVLISRLLCGFASSMWICFIIVFQDRYRDQGSVVASAKLYSVTSSGRLAGMLSATLLILIGDINLIMLSALVFAVIVTVMAFKVQDVKSQVVLSFKESIKMAINNRELMVGSFVVIFSQMVLFGTFFGYSSQLIEENISHGAVGVINVISVLGMVFGPLYLVKIFVAKFKLRATLCIFFAFIAIYLVFATRTHSAIVLSILSFIGGIGCSGSFSALMGYSTSTNPKEIKTLAMGIFQTTVGLGLLLGPIMLGFILESTNMQVAYTSMLSLIILSVILVMALIKKEK